MRRLTYRPRLRLRAPAYTLLPGGAAPEPTDRKFEFCAPGRYVQIITKTGNKGRKKERVDLEPCRSELTFVGKNLSQKLGVDPGAYVQLCHTWGQPGNLVRVNDPDEAQKVAKAYCACRATESTETCLAQAGSATAKERPLTKAEKAAQKTERKAVNTTKSANKAKQAANKAKHSAKYPKGAPLPPELFGVRGKRKGKKSKSTMAPSLRRLRLPRRK